MEKYEQEVALKFSYPSEYIDKAKTLEELLNKNNVKFRFYESNGNCNHKFVIRKSGYTWNEIMVMINSVMSAKYKKAKTWFNENNEEVVLCD